MLFDMNTCIDEPIKLPRFKCGEINMPEVIEERRRSVERINALLDDIHNEIELQSNRKTYLNLF